MSSTQGASHRGRKKALLIAVKKVKDIDATLPQAHPDAHEIKRLLIKHGYAENDIVMLLHDPKLPSSLWPSKKNIVHHIKRLVEGVGEHDRLVFYYSGHGGQTICQHDSEEDGKDEAIYGYNGKKIIDNDLNRLLVNPVLKAKGSQLFALFDCCHSETILDLTHSNCFALLPRIQSLIDTSHTSTMDVPVNKTPWWWFSEKYRLALPVIIPWQGKNKLSVVPRSIIGHANRTLGRLRNGVVWVLRGLFKGSPQPTDGHVQTAPVKQRVSVDATVVSQPDPIMSKKQVSVNTTVVSRSRQNMSKQRVSVNTAVVYKPDPIIPKRPMSVSTVMDSQSDGFMSPDRTMTSPISMFPNCRCTGTCVMTQSEEDEGLVVCVSACRDGESAHDDNETGGTLTKFFLSSLERRASISYQDLLDDIKTQVADLQAKRVAYMRTQPRSFFSPRKRPHAVTSGSHISSIMRKGSTQEPRISSNRPLDFNKKVSF